MGGKPLMKKTVIITVVSTGLLFAGSLSSSEITKMVTKIQKERDGISVLKLDGTRNPFILKIPKKKEVEEVVGEVSEPAAQEVVYTLKSIFNKAAFIDKKWYKSGDTIGNYTVGYVSSDSVVLKRSSGNKILSLKEKKKKFIKLNRGYR